MRILCSHSVTKATPSSCRAVAAIFFAVVVSLISVVDCLDAAAAAAAASSKSTDASRSLNLSTSAAAGSQTAPSAPPLTVTASMKSEEHGNRPPSVPTSPAAVGCVVTPLDSFQHAIIDDLLAEQQLNLIQYVLKFPNSSVNPLNVNLTRVFKVGSTTSVVLKRLCNQFITCMYNN
jgi:hypothetical protein